MLVLLPLASNAKDRVFVTNERSNNISVINAETLIVEDIIDVGDRPRGIGLSPDSSQLYVAVSEENKIVVIGTALPEDQDIKQTPYYNVLNKQILMPGMEVHATAMQQILDNNYISLVAISGAYNFIDIVIKSNNDKYISNIRGHPFAQAPRLFFSPHTLSNFQDRWGPPHETIRHQ